MTDNRLVAAVERGLDTAAQSDYVELSQKAVPAATGAVIRELGPTITNMTNNEPLYQSRVLLGSIAAIVTSSFGIYALWSAGITDGELYAPPIGAILSAGVAIYGRLIARKPLPL